MKDLKTSIVESLDGGANLIILGAISPVFGFIGETLRTISNALRPGGYVIIDEATCRGSMDIAQNQVEECFVVVAELPVT